MCVHRIMAITSAFQADDAGSIPAARSKSSQCLSLTLKTVCVHRIMAITSAFQADDAGSIPAARSNSSSSFIPLDKTQSSKIIFIL
ncbi:hypothetical protein VCHA52P453_110013 [Vibrio chagasii]|nr:hypothetical protein VCHA39P226_120013 [Vibrio chagasii]CAH6929683.1 hypothetical protein VCHA52P453_110013 [Vibrio chagasii]CAH7299185.1 hypothetical protein VCHA52P456_40013 [Vibrio chagasii]